MECELVLLNKESIVVILLPLLEWIKSFWKRGLAHGLPRSLIWLPFRHAMMKVAGFCLSLMTKDIAANWLPLPGLGQWIAHGLIHSLWSLSFIQAYYIEGDLVLPVKADKGYSNTFAIIAWIFYFILAEWTDHIHTLMCWLL